MRKPTTQEIIGNFQIRASRLGVKLKMLHMLAGMHHSRWNRLGNGKMFAVPPDAFERVERYLTDMEDVARKHHAFDGE